MSLSVSTPLVRRLQPRCWHAGWVQEGMLCYVRSFTLQVHDRGTISVVQGVPTSVIDLQPYAVAPQFFAERMRGVDSSTSADIHERLRSIGVLDEDGFCIWKKCENCW